VMSDFDLPKTCDWGHMALGAYAGAGLLYRDAPLAAVVAQARGQMAYLATPYSKIAVGDDGVWDPGRSLEAAVGAARWGMLLAAEGVTAVSPIVQAVEMVHADRAQLLDPLDAVFWERWCRPLLDASDMVIVPPMSGWQHSDGIWAEICAALGRQCRVFLISNREWGLDGLGRP